MAHAPDLDFHKRRPDPQEAGAQQGDHPARTPPVRSGVFNQLGGPYINYVPRANAERLSLIEGDHDTFSHIVSLIGEYEGVLDRHESLAANLGAKLTGPRLLKGIEKFFDGPIKTSSSQPVSAPISWLDVVAFAKASPGEFGLTTMPDGSRCCRFTYNGVHVEITEDDWRLISSGALDRFPLEHPFEEDETAELATVDILEQRASILYKKADEVAARARILHHRLGHRKNDLCRRRSQDNGGPRHQPTHAPGRQHSFSPSYDLHADLLQQFLTTPSSNTKPQSASGAGFSAINLGPSSPSIHSPHHHQQRLSIQSLRSPGGTPLDNQMMNTAESRGEILRSLICQSTDRLSKGDVINPPCDRCRRLRLLCIKHLTACQGCTKKHAKCSWKSVTDDEAARVKYELGTEAEAMADSDNDALGPRDTRHSRPPLESRSSILSSEGTPRPGSRADPDISIPILHSPDSISVARHQTPDQRAPSLATGLGGIPRTREPIHPWHFGHMPGEMDAIRRGHDPSNPPSR
ncbi:C6 finger domain protein, putative [Metarhizium acridum CQMa 102]|uniref:C6 finger domain protein, putative n=1 Tax=Metarhizium acridum (strain CQMa 102) TaxID=655827 RepID=E9EDK3_METAQ|nr:C6 finger domain protein, putative [Metarhizium acridum CQMa 102]EFY85999.1 C6 finger domain protein, putative [Metarhizium acridum CQMa 102]